MPLLKFLNNFITFGYLLLISYGIVTINDSEDEEACSSGNNYLI